MAPQFPASKNRFAYALIGFLPLAVALPAQAQWFGIPDGAKPAPVAPEPPVPAADLQLWLKNAQQSADAARTAQKKGDIVGRNAAVLEAVKWAHKVCDPHAVPEASRRAALETIGLLARDMNGWKATFKEAGVKLELVMIGVRASTLRDKAKGTELARIRMHLAEIAGAQEYPHEAFENFRAAALIADAEEAVVKAAAERAVATVPGNVRSSAGPVYKRMLELPLAPAERKRWENLHAMHLLQTASAGEERVAAESLISKQVFDVATPAAEREEMALVLQEYTFGEDAEKLFAAMLARPNLDAATKSRWLSLRGDRRYKDDKFAEAVADYDLAAQTAPAGSAQRDEAAWDAAMVRVNKLNGKAELIPALDALVASKHLSAEKRYSASTRLQGFHFGAKNYEAAGKLAALRKELAAGNLPRQVMADIELMTAQMYRGQLDAAVTTWTAQPYDEMMNGRKNWGSEKYEAGGKLQRGGVALYQTLIQAKQLELAQKIVDDPDAAKIFPAGDYQLLKADIALNKKDYDGALATLRALLNVARTDNDKATINAYIANVEKMKATP